MEGLLLLGLGSSVVEMVDNDFGLYLRSFLMDRRLIAEVKM